MSRARTLAFLGPDGSEARARIRAFAEERELAFLEVDDFAEIRDLINRSLPACVVLDAAHDPPGTLATCGELKHDPFTAIVPVVDSCYVLENGSTVFEGSSDEFKDNPDVMDAYFGGM